MFRHGALRDRRFVVTGATSGIGRALAEGLLDYGATVVGIGRDQRRVDRANSRTATKQQSGRFVAADLADIPRVPSLVGTISELLHGRAADVLVNNAAVLRSDCKLVHGTELQVAVNYFSHFALTNSLLASDGLAFGGRVVNVVSEIGLTDGTIGDHFWEKPGGTQGYANSKLALLLFSLELHRRAGLIEGLSLSVNAVDPGSAVTRLDRDILPWSPLPLLARLLRLRGPRRASRALMYLATANEVDGVSGLLLDEDRKEELLEAILDPQISFDLWEEARRRAVALTGSIEFAV